MGRKRLRKVCRGLLRKRSGFEKDLGCAAVSGYSFDRAHVIEDRRADHWMDELERVLLGKEIVANEHARRGESGRRTEAGQLGDEGNIGSITEDGGGP
jgi:hypothetical protein